MKRKPKKSEIILIGVLIAVIFWVVSLDSKVKRTRAGNEAAKAAAKSTQNPLQAAIAAADNPIRPKLEIGDGDLSPFWGPDPFDRPFAREVLDAAASDDWGQPEEEPDRLRLFGVIVADRGAAALIDRSFCAEGDTIAGHLVESISKERVVLRNLRDDSVRKLTVE